MTNIEHTNGKLIFTNMKGETASRLTNNSYEAAIMGRAANGKLVVCYAGWTVEAVNLAFSMVKNGKFVNHKFTGVTELEIITKSEDWIPEAPDAWMIADDALVAAHRAK